MNTPLKKITVQFIEGTDENMPEMFTCDKVLVVNQSGEILGVVSQYNDEIVTHGFKLNTIKEFRLVEPIVKTAPSALAKNPKPSSMSPRSGKLQ